MRGVSRTSGKGYSVEMRFVGSIVVAMLVSSLVFSSADAQNGGLVRIWDVKDATQTGQLTIYNADAEGCLLGEPVGSGDVDGDGFADIVTCSFYGPAGPGNNRRGAGKLHLWFGGADVLAGGLVYDADAPTGRYVEIWGARADDFLGSEVDIADVTGDGLADILVCAENSSGFGSDANRDHAGCLYVIPGRADISGPIDLAHPPAGVIQILGATAGDRFGFWVTAGDVNGDGLNDIIASADLAKGSGGAGNARGITYVIPGSASLPSRIDLGNASTVRDLGITTIYGIDDFDHFGSAIVTGDFDGDGMGDVAIGAGLSRAGAAFSGVGLPNNALGQGGGDGPNGDREDAGEAYVLFGRSQWPATIQMSNPPSDATIVYGDQPGGYFGEEVRAGDVDGDGKDELAVGALVADAPGDRNAAGLGYVFWSRQFGRGKRIDARSASASAMTTIYGQARGDIGADSVLLADVDRDGFSDILFGSPLNTPLPSRSGAGDLKIIFGRSTGLPGIVDTASPPAGVTIYQLYAADPGDMFTYSLTVGDVDGDGYLDIIPNSMGGDGSGNRFDAAGDAFAISGKVFAERTGRGPDAPTCLSRVTVTPALKTYYAGEAGIELSLFCDAASFEDGAVVSIRGVEVPTELVSPSEIRVSLDDAPEVLTTAGQLTVQVRNPGAGLSTAVLSITLVGPTIKKIRVTVSGSEFVLKVKGRNFLEGASATVHDGEGADVATTSVVRKNKKTVMIRIARDAIAGGSNLMVFVVNPGGASSPPQAVTLP